MFYLGWRLQANCLPVSEWHWDPCLEIVLLEVGSAQAWSAQWYKLVSSANNRTEYPMCLTMSFIKIRKKYNIFLPLIVFFLFLLENELFHFTTKRYNEWPCQKPCDALHYLLDNMFNRFSSDVVLDCIDSWSLPSFLLQNFIPKL